jgi:hypothetical protein
LNHGILVAADTISNLRSKREVNILDVKIGSINPSDLQPLFDKISGISDFTFLSNDTVQLRLQKDCQAHTVIGQLTLNQIPVREVREVGNNLEDIYMEIVKMEAPDNES